MNLAEQIQVWEKEKEYVCIEHGDYVAVICWQDEYYKIPFFVLEDLLNEMVQEKRDFRQQLGMFLNVWKCGTWNEKPIELLKMAIEKEMPGMEAYKLYN